MLSSQNYCQVDWSFEKYLKNMWSRYISSYNFFYKIYQFNANFVADKRIFYVINKYPRNVHFLL